MERTVSSIQISREDIAALPEAGFFSWDMVADVIYADSALAELFGLDPTKTSVGLPIKEYLDRVVDEDRPVLAEVIRNCILGDHPQQHTYRVVNRYNELVTVIGYGRVFRTAGGEPAQYVGLVVPCEFQPCANDN